MDGDVMNLTGMGIHQISLPSGADPTTVILDKNSISKIDNLDKCPSLKQLSLAGNRMVRMTSVSKLRNITVLNLPNNSIVAIEGLKELTDLEWLNLSANRIKGIEGLTNNPKLRHLDLSDNSITQVAGLAHLICLRTLLLHGNIITTLESAPQSLPRSLAILSLAENEITDLNEVSFLSCFELEQVSLMNNPCVLMTSSTPGFDARPFIINWIQTLLVLDGFMVTEKERLKAEWLYSQGKGRHFRSGQQAEIVEYLSSVCPLTSSAQTRSGRVKRLVAKLESQEDAKLSQILSKQKQHKEQLHQGRQHSSPDPPHLTAGHHPSPPEHQSHSSVSFSTQEQNQSFGNTGVSTFDIPVDLVGRPASPKYGVDRVPLQAWTSSNDRSASLGFQKGTSTDQQGRWHLQDVGVEADNDAKSHSSLLESESTYLPLEIASTPNRPMTAPAVTSSAPLNNYPFYMQTDNRPATSAETRYDAYDRRPIKPLNTDVFKGIRHNFQVSPPTQSGNEPALGTKKKTPPTAQAHDYDTSQEASQIEEILNPTKENIPVEEISNIKDISKDRRSSARRSTSQRSDGKSVQRKKDSERSERSSIPVSSKTSASISRTHSDYTPGRYALRKQSQQSVKSSYKPRRKDSKSKGNRDSGVFSRPSSDAILDTDNRAATLIQATWRGYWAREHNPEVISVRKEMRARRAEDHIVVLRAELDRQRKLYDEERHMRGLQMEAIRCLWKEVQSLQNWKSEVLSSHQFRNNVDSSHQDDSYNYSQEIQNTLERVGLRHGDSGRVGSMYSMEDDRQKELERTCASLQNQVAQLSQALQSVSSVVFQSGIMTAGMDSIHNEVDQTLLVTGYEEEESSSCEETSFTGSKWATVPHSLSPYPSEEEEQYFYSFPQLGCPIPPRNLHMDHKGENSVVISWESSKILDSSFKEVNKPLLGYRVYVDDKPTAMINGLSALVHGLNPQVTYKIYVKAVSSLGESNSSDILMAAMSQAARARASSTDSNRTDSDHDSTESSDVARRRKENPQRQKRRIKSPRQDKRQSSRKGSSASDQDRPPSRSEKSKSNIGASGVFKQPKIHMRPSSRDSSRVPELHAESEYPESAQGLPQPSESKRSPQAGSQNRGPSTSQMSETFTVESSESLLMAISRAQSSLGMNESSDQSVKTHRRKRSKDFKTSDLQDDDVNQNQGSPSAGSVHFQNVVDQRSKVGGDKDNMNKSEDIPREKTHTHRRTRSKDYEWRKEIEPPGHTRDPERREVKKAWVKDSPTGEVHGIPIIDASKRHSSGSRPSSPAPSDTSEKSDKKRTVAELLEKFSSKASTNFGTNSLGTEGSEQHAGLPPRSRRTNSNEDVSAMPESRRTPTKNMSPSYTERRRTPSNGSESDASELSSSSAARQLDMDRKPGSGTTGISKLLQKLQNFSKSQEESIQNRAQKMKKKSTSESPGIEEELRRPRRISGGSEGDSVSERTIHQSDSSSHSDDPQLNKKPYKTHRRSGSDQKVTVSHHQQSSAPPTPSHRSARSDSSRFDDYTPRPGSNVKRTASFHGVKSSPHKEVQPRRSGSDENLYDKKQDQTAPEMFTTGMFSRKQKQDKQSGINLHHIPILSGAQLQKQQKPT